MALQPQLVFGIHGTRRDRNKTQQMNFCFQVGYKSTTEYPLQQRVQGMKCRFELVAQVTTLCNEGRLKDALSLTHHIDHQSINGRGQLEIYACLLDLCAAMNALGEGKQVHRRILMAGLHQNVFLSTKLVTMYAACGNLWDARQVFDNMSKRNVFLWTAMINGYVKNGLYEEAVAFYFQMRREGIFADNFTFSSVLKACSGLSALNRGKEIHVDIIKSGVDPNVFVGTALIDMYVKCGKVEDARQAFDEMPERNVASWNTVILGYAQSWKAEEALELFHQMSWNGIQPNSRTLVSILRACIEIAALKWGMELHGHIIKADLEFNGFIGSVLVNMYARFGRIKAARQVFDRISERDVVVWSSMVTAYSQNGYANEALKLFRCMHHNGMQPNPVTIAGILPACGDLASLKQGKEIHGYIIKNKIESNVFVCSSLIDMYAKCGYVELARQVFDQKSERDVISWTAMIAGYGMNGQGEKALRCFYQMREQGLKPNDVTFVVLLSACSHAGLVVEGWQHFDSMSKDYHIIPRLEHYACIVDLLGRAGRLEDAENFIQNMPVKPNAAVWGALLGACRIHCNIELAERVAGHLFEIEPENTGNYILLSNIYAAAGRWNDVESIRRMMEEKGIKPRAGCSWIEYKSKVCVFRVGDKSHPQAEEIYAMLRSLAGKMKDVGYVPATKFVLQNVEESEKENILCGHSERLALGFGLINTGPRLPIRITKNIRVCGDCHSAIKAISTIVGREIIVRDSQRFHHFRDGACSCGDYW